LQREQASTNLEFEDAAAHHARLDKLKPLLQTLPEVVHRIDRLSGLLVQPSATPDCVTFFRFDAAWIAGPLTFPIQSSEHTKSQSMDARIQEALTSMPASEGKSALEVTEHLAILKRWYYRGTRVGEIFFADDKGVLPMRRIVRGISRVYKGEKPEELSTQMPSS